MTPLLVATSHGTDSLPGQAAIRALVDALADRLGDDHVAEAFVDVQAPYVGDVVASAGRPCVVVPLLLSPGYHVHHDIARAVAPEQHTAARTMGPDIRIAETMRQRLVEAGYQPGDTVVMAAAGSTDVRAREATDEAASQLAKVLGTDVAVGHLGGTGTPLADVIAQHAGERIALASYLLAAGHFDDMVIAAAAEVKTRPLLPDTTPDPRIVDVVVERYAEAAGVREM